LTVVALRRRSGPERVALATICAAWAVWWLAQLSTDPATRILGISAMGVGMMVPLALPAARHVARNTLRRRRLEAVLTFLGAFASVWILVSLGAVLLASVGGQVSPISPGFLILATIATVAWHWTPWRRRALRACVRSRPLPPDGWPAREACLAFGITVGRRCAVSCWPAMLLVMSAGAWHLLVALPVTVLLLAERSIPTVRRSRWIVPASIAAVGTMAVVLGPGVTGPSVVAWLCQIPRP
jgi:predicted metal-binding membrane protein